MAADNLHNATVIVRPIYVGLCISDIKEVKGVRSVRRDFGHEVYGQVVKSQTDSFSVGERVILNPHVKVNRSTGFADLMTISGESRTVARSLIAVDETLPEHRAVYAEPLACAVHACLILKSRLGSTLYGARIAVIGAGVAGIAISLCAQAMGANVVVFNRGQAKLKRLSQSRLSNALDLRPLHELSDLEFDVILITTTFLTEDVLILASSGVQAKGHLLLYGGTDPSHAEESGLDIDRIRREEDAVWTNIAGKRIRLVGSYGASITDLEHAIQLLKLPDFHIESLTSELVSLTTLVTYLNSTALHSHDAKKVVQVSQPEFPSISRLSPSNEISQWNIC